MGAGNDAARGAYQAACSMCLKRVKEMLTRLQVANRFRERRKSCLSCSSSSDFFFTYILFLFLLLLQNWTWIFWNAARMQQRPPLIRGQSKTTRKVRLKLVRSRSTVSRLSCSAPRRSGKQASFRFANFVLDFKGGTRGERKKTKKKQGRSACRRRLDVAPS